MTTPASPDHGEPWYLLGAGNMGLLAAHYLQRAGFSVIVLRRDAAPTLERTLILPNGDTVRLQLLCERALPAKGAKPRQDPRARSNDSTNNASGIPPAGSAGLSRARPAPCMFDPEIWVRFGPVTGEAVRSWKQRSLTSFVERLPASLPTPKGIQKPVLRDFVYTRSVAATSARSGNR